MTRHVFTREVLYDRVWAEPMTKIAASLGVSDAGLAKACRKAAIPLPPRGYWVRLQHGKAVNVPPALPDRPDLPDRVVISPPVPRPIPSPAVAAVLAEASVSPPIAVPRDLRGAHAIVQGWVEDNARRRREDRSRGWSGEMLDDLSTPLAQRRLRLTSAILKALEHRGLKVGQGREGLTLTRGQDTLTFTIYERGRMEHRPATTDELRWQPDRKTVRATVPAGDLVVKIRTWLDGRTEFRELKTPLEDQLGDIVARLNAGVTELAEKRKVRTLEKERWEAAERDRRKRAAYAEAEAALRNRLISQADRLRQAEAIRALVAAADASVVVQQAAYAGWKAWALAEADALDPLIDGSVPFTGLPPVNEWTWRGS